MSTRPRSVRTVLGATGLALFVVSACAKLAAEGEQTSLAQDAGPEAGDAGVALADGGGFPDAPYVSLDAATRGETTRRIEDAAQCASRTPCDCDDDGFADTACPLDAGTLLSARGEPLRPGDCDDLDPLRFPGQGFVADKPPPGRDGDWNCDRVTEFPLEWGAPLCEQPSSGGACREFDVFIQKPACGEPNWIYRCGVDETRPGGCGAFPVGPTTLPCR